MNDEDFCRAFCHNLALREVPIGYVLRTPFRRTDGDAISIYLRLADDGTVRLEDDGMTVGYLEANGFDLESDSRFESLADMLKEHGAFLDEGNCLIHTAALPAPEAPGAAVRFSALLVRIYDLLLLTPARVRSTFKDDLVELVERQFGLVAGIEVNEAVQESMKDYVVDVIVRARDGRTLAIYAATSELKALEALLFWNEYRNQRIENLRAMLVVETSKPRDIKEKTFSRVMNSDILLASMEGGELQIGRKIRENVLA
jgi:Domain of unknown function DUF1828